MRSENGDASFSEADAVAHEADSGLTPGRKVKPASGFRFEFRLGNNMLKLNESQ